MTLGACTTLSAVAAHPERRACLRGRGDGGRTRLLAAAAQHGDDRRQRVRRHALQLLQPDVRVAEGDRLLHEEGRRHLPGRAAQLRAAGRCRRRTPRPRSGASARASGWWVPTASARSRWPRCIATTASSTSRKRPDEIVTEILLPPAEGWRSVYLKLRRRGSFDFPILGVAVAARLEGEVVREARIVLGAVASLPREATRAAAGARRPAPDHRRRSRRRPTRPRAPPGRSTTRTSRTPTARRSRACTSRGRSRGSPASIRVRPWRPHDHARRADQGAAAASASCSSASSPRRPT